MVVNKWKVAFWIVLFILVAETSLVYYEWSVQTQQINNEAYCSNSICYPTARSFIYDYSTHICSCYDKDKQIIQQVKLE